MRGAVFTAVGAKGPNTYFKGVDTINDIWVTKEIEVSNVGYLPYDAELEDHQPVIANKSKQLMIWGGGSYRG